MRRDSDESNHDGVTSTTAFSMMQNRLAVVSSWFEILRRPPEGGHYDCRAIGFVVSGFSPDRHDRDVTNSTTTARPARSEERRLRRHWIRSSRLQPDRCDGIVTNPTTTA